MQTGDHELRLVFVKRVWEHTVPRKDNRAFHQVLQLANVAWPGIPLKGSHGFRRNAVDLLPHTAAKHLHEVRDKSRDVFAASAERGEKDGEDIQTIIEVTTKLPASQHFHQISIGCRYQSNIHFVRATAS